MNRAFRIGVLLFLSHALLVMLAHAQGETPTRVTDQNRSGDLPFSSSIGTDIEHVDLASGALNIKIPLIHIPGRGMDSDLYLHWNSNYFLLAPRTDGQGRPYFLWTTEEGSGWQPNNTGHIASTFRINCGGVLGYWDGDTNYIYTDPSGTKHPMAMQAEIGACAPSGNSGAGPDLTGQGMWSTAPSGGGFVFSVLTADGSTEDLQDSNGNQEDNSIGLDTLGRAFYTTQTTSNGNGQLTQTKYTYTDSNGNPQTYTINWELVSINTNFQANTGPYGPNIEITNGSANVISSIVLPNNKQYAFKYNDAYGELTEIDLPTGAVITYTWANVEDGRSTRRYVTSRTEIVNGVSATWSLAVAATEINNYTNSNYSSTVTYPAVGNPAVQNQSVFTSVSGGITDAKIYSGAVQGTPLREYQMGYATDHDPTVDDSCYNSSGIMPPLIAQPVGQRLTSISTILEDGQTQSQKLYYYETFTYPYYPNHCPSQLSNNVEVTYTTSRGNVTEIDEYGWGQGAHGPLVRRIDKTYLHSTSNPGYLNYLSRNIVSKVLQDTIYDGISNQMAQTQYEYDTTTLLSSGGAPQHNSNYSTAFIYRGNPSRVKRWRNTDGQLVTTTYNYDDLGNIRSIVDPKGNSTTYDYTDAWENGACPPASNSNAYVTTVTNALNQRTKQTYFPCTALLYAHHDQNDINAGRTGALYSYDLLGRLLQQQDTHLSTDGSWGQTTITYNDTPPVSVSTATAITSSVNKTSVTIEDGLGRVSQTQLTSDPDGATYVDTSYDALGRKATVSNPYRSGSLPTDGTTTYGYDPLSRITSVLEPDGSQILTSYSGACTTVTDEAGRTRKSCSDGLGRLTQVFEDLTGFNYETDYNYDALNNLKQVTQGSETRSFSYDSLSRLLSAANPESGTTNYSYLNSVNALCSGDSSNPCIKTDARGIATFYSYDTLNRLTQKTYGDSTPTTGYQYDQARSGGTLSAIPSVASVSNLLAQRNAFSATTRWGGLPPSGNVFPQTAVTARITLRCFTTL